MAGFRLKSSKAVQQMMVVIRRGKTVTAITVKSCKHVTIKILGMHIYAFVHTSLVHLASGWMINMLCVVRWHHITGFLGNFVEKFMSFRT